MMSLYVTIDRLCGTRDFLALAENLHSRGYGATVEYFEGGWADGSVTTVLSHLRFQDEQDAYAFALAFGGTVSQTVPTRTEVLTIESGTFNRGTLLCLI